MFFNFGPIGIRLRQRSIGAWFAISFGLVAAFIFLLAIGFLAAVAPTFIAKTSAVFLLITVMLFGALSRTDVPIKEIYLQSWVTLLLCTLALWPSYLLFKTGGLPAIEGRRLVVGISILAAVYLLISRTDVREKLFNASGPLKTGAWIVTVYAAWRLLSCIDSPAPLFSAVQVIWETFYYFALFFLGFLFFASERSVSRIHQVMVFLAIAISIFTVLERAMGENLLVRFAPRGDEFSGFLNSLASSRVRDGQYRTQGTFEHPLLLAEFAAMTACFALAKILWSESNQRYARYYASIALVGSVVCAEFSGSRSAYISFAVGLGAVVALRLVVFDKSASAKILVFLKRFFVFAFAVAALLVMLAVLPYLAKGNSYADEASSAGRIVMLENGLNAIQDMPLFGGGPGIGATVASLQVRPDLATLDNYLLAIALESGIPALIFFCIVFLYTGWICFLRITSGSVENPSFLAAVVGSLLAVLAMRFILWMPYNLSFVFLFVGVALSMCVTINKSHLQS